MKKIILFSCLFITMMILFLISKQSVPTIQYFPADQNATITDAKTDINISKNRDANEFTWSIYSNSSEKAYLRQDVSLLYLNGYFKGVLAKWEQNSSEISSQQSFTLENDALIQAITFHYGEIHDEKQTIHSVQQMTNNQLYFLNTATDNKNNINDKKKMDETTNKLLTTKWDQLIKYFNVDANQYTLIPLVDVINYQTQPLPNQTMEQTNKIIGQFWEGLYKKYVLLLKEKEKDHYMPIILLANDQTHLLLLFELDSEKYQYIQKI